MFQSFYNSCDSGYNYTSFLAKAFHAVDHDILLQKLFHYGIRGVTKYFFRSFLKNRTQLLMSFAKENSSHKSNNIDVPQGSILGTLLFLIYINDLPNCMNRTTRLTADDRCPMINAPTLKDSEKIWYMKLSKNLGRHDRTC